jgi:hypothetical protein
MLRRVGLLFAIPPVARIPHLQVYFEAIVMSKLGIGEARMVSTWRSFLITSLDRSTDK